MRPSINTMSILITKELERKSRFLSLILRHDPSKGNLQLDKEGWAKSSDVLKALQVNKAALEEIVEKNDKKRFELSEDGRKIRASQGHSLKDVDIKFEDVTEEMKGKPLLHGTKSKNLESIMKEGLKKMSRQHVHLTIDMHLAVKRSETGKGTGVVLMVVPDGQKVWRSKNNVYLMEDVPPHIIKEHFYTT